MYVVPTYVERCKKLLVAHSIAFYHVSYFDLFSV
jgi:hypothetical protein